MKLVKIFAVLGVIVALLAGAVFHYFMDGALPEDPEFAINIEELRELAEAPSELRPTTIEYEIVARRDVPKLGTQAGLERSPITMARAVFRLRSEWGDTMIDVGMTDATRQEFMAEDVFEAEAMERVTAAVAGARSIVVTHEHPDHIGLLGQIESIRPDADGILLTAEQLAGIPKFADNGELPAMLAGLKPVSSDKPTVVAPGVVMLPAAGHTPGSVIFFVAMADGREVLFLGDTVWNMSNIRDALGRPRFVQQFLMPEPEDRGAVYDQLASVIALAEREPDLIMLPSHDEDNIDGLVKLGLLSHQMNSEPEPALQAETAP
ncbi:MBL fold metallo-hydrolase [Pontixanthobacter sp. CEM42]|uniref:MBL fold metallo-hydrolase n=1 Tax=Pontixanthobacter sp. CEM42 TaxID=2792077 RepID=UPI001ADF7CE7|nr:MBL fold metallo-hydrolase [Pontixanthobacter sp. CEM42]